MDASNFIARPEMRARVHSSQVRLVYCKPQQPVAVDFTSGHRAMISARAETLSAEFARDVTAWLIDRVVMELEIGLTMGGLQRAHAIINSMLRRLEFREAAEIMRNWYELKQDASQCPPWYRHTIRRKVAQLLSDYSTWVKRWLNYRSGSECSDPLAPYGEPSLLPGRFDAMLGTVTVWDTLIALEAEELRGDAGCAGEKLLRTKRGPYVHFRGHPECLVSLSQVSQSLRVSEWELNGLVSRGQLPRPIQICGQMRWRASAIAEMHAAANQADIDELFVHRGTRSLAIALAGRELNASLMSEVIAVPRNRLLQALEHGQIPVPREARDGVGPIWEGDAILRWLSGDQPDVSGRERLLRKSALLEILNVNHRQFARCSDFPAPILIDGLRRWRSTEVFAWIERSFARGTLQ